LSKSTFSSILSTALCGLVLTALPVPAGAQTELSGQTPGGAFYRILVPDGWTPADGLVIWNHGFDLDPIEPNPSLGPLVDVQRAEGYAIAASSYSLTGWAVFETHKDNAELLDVFESQFGVPEHVFVTGASLGGIVTARDIEAGLLGNVVGALPICGALAGSRLWEGGVDLRLLYDFVCDGVPGADIAGGADGLPPGTQPTDLNRLQLAGAVQACTGAVLPDIATPAQDQRLQRILDLTGLPESFFLVDMDFVTFGLSNLVHDPDKLGGATALGNENVDYGDAAINAGIARVKPDPAARQRLFDSYTPTGNVGDVKIVSIHTDKDGLVLVENESAYASVVPAANLTTGIVVEDEPTHCGFNEAEVLAAWEILRGWVAGAPQPSPNDLQGTCEALAAGDLASGPCRFDPNFVVPDLDGRVRPRADDQTPEPPEPRECIPDLTTLCLNDGRFEVKVDWRTQLGTSGLGMAKDLTDDTGYFWFFNEENVELVIKVLDACDTTFNRYWVFAGGLTNVEVKITVTDTQKPETKTYGNILGQPFQPIQDTNAFATCP